MNLISTCTRNVPTTRTYRPSFSSVPPIALASLLLAAAACSGDEGAAGPPGPQGPPGTPAPGASAPVPVLVSGAALDVHTHLASPTLTKLFGGTGMEAANADELVQRLDDANVQRAVVLSAGYMGWPVGLMDDSNMAPENDFVAAEVARHPTRLIGFCGINPLFPSAVAEITRCLGQPGMVGVKIHLPGSGVDLTSAQDAAALDAVLGAIEARNAPALMHVGTAFGLPLDSDGLTNLGIILDSHPAVRLVHAHCAGAVDDQDIERLLRSRGVVTANSFVEGSACLKFFRDAPESQRELMVWRFRRWGIDRVLFGSDYLKVQPEETPAEALQTLSRYPFTQEEINTILSNDGSAWLLGQ